MTAANTFLGGGLAFGDAGNTIMRMIGEYILMPATAPVVADAADVTIGIGFVSGDAFTLGASAVPDPVSEPEYPWLYWKVHPVRFGSTDLDPSGMAGTVRATFDVKSKQKAQANHTLAFVVQYADFVGTPPLTLLVGQTRVMIALP